MQGDGVRAQDGLSGWTTKEVVVAAVIAAIMGLVFMAYSVLWMALSPILGTVPVMILYGFYFSAGILVPYIIRKPGAAVAGETLAALTEVLAGSPFGAIAILHGFLQGLGAEAAFAIGRWRRYNLVILGLAGALSAVPAFGLDYYFYSYSQLAVGAQIAIFALMVLSGIVLGGFVSKGIGDALARTGVLSGFAIGRDRAKPVS